MPEPIVYGFPRSTFVNIVRLILTQKDVDYEFHDLEPVTHATGEVGVGEPRQSVHPAMLCLASPLHPRHDGGLP